MAHASQWNTHPIPAYKEQTYNRTKTNQSTAINKCLIFKRLLGVKAEEDSVGWILVDVYLSLPIPYLTFRNIYTA